LTNRRNCYIFENRLKYIRKGGGQVKKLLKSFHCQRGFTLIELLVVVAILGVLAAVVVPNVVRFMGSGTIEAANTEAHDVQTAVVAYMADNNLTRADGDVGPEADLEAGDAGTTVHSFLVNASGLQAIYTIGGSLETTGEIVSATTEGVEGSKWTDLVYDPAVGWEQAPTT